MFGTLGVDTPVVDCCDAGGPGVADVFCGIAALRRSIACSARLRSILTIDFVSRTALFPRRIIAAAMSTGGATRLSYSERRLSIWPVCSPPRNPPDHTCRPVNSDRTGDCG